MVEGHSVETVIDPDALRAVTPAEGVRPAPERRRTRFGTVYEAVAAVGIGSTVAWDVVKSVVAPGRGGPPRAD